MCAAVERTWAAGPAAYAYNIFSQHEEPVVDIHVPFPGSAPLTSFLFTAETDVELL